MKFVMMFIDILCPAAASERRPQPVRGPGGGFGGTQRHVEVGDGLQRELGHGGGHGGVSAAGPGLRQPCLPGASPLPPVPVLQIFGRVGAAGGGGKLFYSKYKPQTTAFSFEAIAGGTLRVKNSLHNSNWGEPRAEGACFQAQLSWEVRLP